MRQRLGGFVGLVAWLATLGAAIVAFTWLGHGGVGTPAVSEPTSWIAWSRSSPPDQVVFALGRLLVLGLAWYLLGVTVVGVVARMGRSLLLVRLADAVTVPGVRRMLHAAMGFGLATAAVAPSTAALVIPAYAVAAPYPSRTTATVTQPPPAAPPSSDRTRPPSDPGRPPSDATRPPSDPTRRPGNGGPDPLWHLRIGSPGSVPAPGAGGVPPSGAVHPTEVASPPAPFPSPSTPPRPRPATGASPLADAAVPSRPPEPRATVDADVWEVHAGDHLWGIAEQVVSRHLGRRATDREVAGYWRRLIAANRGALADPGDPDLIYPGQRFALPAVAGAEG